jgi:hypothetical protein
MRHNFFITLFFPLLLSAAPSTQQGQVAIHEGTKKFYDTGVEVLRYEEQTESDPSFLGATSHIMAIARKEKK